MSAQDSHGLYSSRQGMAYSGGMSSFLHMILASSCIFPRTFGSSLMFFLSVQALIVAVNLVACTHQAMAAITYLVAVMYVLYLDHLNFYKSSFSHSVV